ncbi:MAG: hypothetical protein PHE79_12015 [Eubacteriales bacterium]|nr:hypothetical protein [Eubacteriales bacterium]
MDIGEMIPADDSVRLLNAVLERMDYQKLHAAYSRLGRIERSPESLFKVLVCLFQTKRSVSPYVF